MKNNQLTEFPSGAEYQKLEFLDISSNEFTAIPLEIAAMVNLRSLYIGHNPYSSYKLGSEQNLMRLTHLFENNIYSLSLKNAHYTYLHEYSICINNTNPTMDKET